MTVHLLETTAPKPATPHKRKVVELVAMLKRGHPMSASELAQHCDMHPSNVASTLDLLLEYDLVRFAGKGAQPASGGHRPATWRWV